MNPTKLTKSASPILSAGFLALAASGAAHAVTAAPDGLGQVLLYPYYTVEGGYDTLLSVTNATTHGKALKVRLLEALNGRPVFSLNVYLGARDVWTAMVTADAGGGAKLVVSDSSCTAPVIATALGGSGEMALLSSGFDGSGNLPADALARVGTARTREGYVEVIEMGDIASDYRLSDGTHFLSAISYNDSTQAANGEDPPANCAAVNNEWATAQPFPSAGYGATASTSVRGLLTGSGGLGGTGTLINVAQGTDYSYDPVVLAGFYMTKPPMHTPADDPSPSLADAAPTSSVVYLDPTTGIPSLKSDDWSNSAAGAQPGADAVSAVLTRAAVINEYVVNTAISAGTDWVITLPTKRWYVDQVFHPVRPFSAVFGATGACEQLAIAPYDQSGTTSTGRGIGFPEAPLPRDKLCWTTNVVTFNNSNVLASTLNDWWLNGQAPYSDNQALRNLNVGAWRAGRVSLSFPNSTGNASYYWANAQSAVVDLPGDVVSHRLINEAAPNHVHPGLPMIGFAVQQYTNGTLSGGVLSNYGGAYLHRYQRNITP